MFIMGGCGLAYEYTFSRIASDLLGNSVRQWAIIIGVMLFFMGIGADLQKYLKDKHLLDKLLVSEIILGILGGLGPIALLNAYSQFNMYYVFVQYFFICSIGLLIGFEIPLITRINQAYAKDLKVNLAKILKMDYIGSLAGAFFWIFVLSRYFTLVESAILLGIINLTTAGITLAYFWKLVRYSKEIGICIICLLVGLVFAFTQGSKWASYAEQNLYRDRIVFKATSQYQHIVVTKNAQGEVACYINGRLQFNSADEFIYHENLVHPAMIVAPRRERILILGGGDGLALREVLKYADVQEVVLVDLDPEMTDLAAKNPLFVTLNEGSLSHAKTKVLKNRAIVEKGKEVIRVKNYKQPMRHEVGTVAEVSILNLDAAQFVEQAAGRFDVIILDFPDPSTLELAKLYSKRFYTHVGQKLARDGIFVQQSTSPIHAREAFLCIMRTWEQAGFSVVPFHDNVPSFGEWGWILGGHQSLYSADKLKKKLNEIESLSVSAQYITPELIRASLAFGKDQLFSENNDITTLDNPNAFEYYLKSWRSEN